MSTRASRRWALRTQPSSTVVLPVPGAPEPPCSSVRPSSRWYSPFSSSKRTRSAWSTRRLMLSSKSDCSRVKTGSSSAGSERCSRCLGPAFASILHLLRNEANDVRHHELLETPKGHDQGHPLTEIFVARHGHHFRSDDLFSEGFQGHSEGLQVLHLLAPMRWAFRMCSRMCR